MSRLRGIRAESSRVVCSPPWCEKRALRGRGSIRPCVRSVPGLSWVHYKFSSVQFKKGHYHDGIYVKKNNLVLALVETSGGVSPPFLRHVGRLSRRARASGAVDRTRYGSVRMSPKSYFVHLSLIHISEPTRPY